jgi:1L-myo-inositol 1-phosphate cytidylyltransferase
MGDAVILMAGSGSRLAGSDPLLPKPLIPIGGQPLISYALNAFAKIGVRTIHAILGANSDALRNGLTPLMPSGMRLHPIFNSAWHKQNGISLLSAAGKVHAPFFLTMGDHLFDGSILETLVVQADPNRLNLGVDKKIDTIFDRDDAMKVQTDGDRVRSIGKDLRAYDAIDTGLFVCPDEIFDYLRRAKRNDDCSLADGVRLMATDDKVLAIDIGDAWWQDVDTPQMLQHAEQKMTARHAS